MAARISFAEAKRLGLLKPGETAPPASRGVKQGWRVVGGRRIFFRSGWEANVALYLEWQRARGLIRRWDYEPIRFVFDGERHGITSYKPDFRIVHNDGSEVWWEVKGQMRRGDKTKLTRMAKYHPHIKLVLVGEVQYRQIAARMRGLLPGWE